MLHLVNNQKSFGKGEAFGSKYCAIAQRLPLADRHKSLPECFAYTEYIFIPFRQPLFLDRRSRTSSSSEGRDLSNSTYLEEETGPFQSLRGKFLRIGSNCCLIE